MSFRKNTNEVLASILEIVHQIIHLNSLSKIYFGKFRSNNTAYEENETENPTHPWTGSSRPGFTEGSKKAFLDFKLCLY